MEVSHKDKHSLIIQFSHHAARYLFKWIKKLYSHKNLHMDLYRSFIHNRQMLMQPKSPSTDEWIKKQNKTVVQLYKGILFCDLKKKMKYHTMKRHRETLNAYCLVKEASLKRLNMV